MFGQKPVLNAGDEVLSFGGTPGTVSGSGSGTEGVLSTAARGDHSHDLGEHDHSDSDHGGTLSLADIISGNEGNVLRYDSVNGWEVASGVSIDDNGVVGIGASGTGNAQCLYLYDNTAGSTNPVLEVRQDAGANTGYAVNITHDGSGHGIYLNQPLNSGTGVGIYHVKNSVGGPAYYLDTINDSDTALEWRTRRRRGGATAGQDDDNLFALTSYGNNDASEQIQFARILTRIGDATDGTEAGTIQLQVANGVNGSLGTMVEVKGSNLGFYGVTPTAQAAHILDPSGGGTQDAEARSAINAILVVLENVGLNASA